MHRNVLPISLNDFMFGEMGGVVFYDVRRGVWPLRLFVEMLANIVVIM